MKSLMILGGLIGLAIGLLFGLANRSDWPDALWRASAAALIAGMLLRWWGRVWIKSLRAAHEQQMSAATSRDKEGTGVSAK
jgi:hypothetical protein